MQTVMGELDDNPQTTIYMVRHGETALNAQHKMRGWDNPPLNPDGEKDAEDAGKALQPIKLDKIYSSDLQRAVQTAEAIRSYQTGSPEIQEMHNLRTIDVGAWTGRPLDKVEPQMLELQKAWITDPKKAAPAGESWMEFQDRQIEAWREILTDRPLPKSIAVVAHLRTCIWAMGWAVRNAALYGEDLKLLNHLHQFPGRVTVMSFSKKEGFKLMAVSAAKLDMEDELRS